MSSKQSSISRNIEGKVFPVMKVWEAKPYLSCLASTNPRNWVALVDRNPVAYCGALRCYRSWDYPLKRGFFGDKVVKYLEENYLKLRELLEL